MGKLEKLKITSYKDEDFSSKLGVYALRINPEKYSQNHATEYNKKKGTETAGITTKYVVIKPQVLKFEFYLDATGVVASIQDIPAEIQKFKKVAYHYNGDIHSPNYLVLTWGTLGEKKGFKCRLTSMDVEYSLFKSNGTPLRAKISVSFEQFLSPAALKRAAGKNSPDMTHIRIVQAGDNLPLMCHRIYGDSRHYLEIARYNRLSDILRLEPGTRITFPPLKT